MEMQLKLVSHRKVAKKYILLSTLFAFSHVKCTLRCLKVNEYAFTFNYSKKFPRYCKIQKISVPDKII